MKFQSQKLRIASWIVFTGFAAACLYHFIQGAVFSRGYPYNTFLFLPSVRFSDFFDVLRAANAPDPYSVPLTVYFPFSYPFFYAATRFFEPFTALLVIFACSLAALTLCLYEIFGSFDKRRSTRIAATLVITLLSYPVICCCDRGNTEVVLGALVAAFLLFYSRGRYWVSLIFLVPAICMKLYPAALLALFLPRARFIHIAAAGFAFIVISGFSLSHFDKPMGDEYREWQGQLGIYRAAYLIGNKAMGGSSSPWNICKLCYTEFFLPQDDSSPSTIDSQWVEKTLKSVSHLLNLYSLATAALAFFIVFHIVRVEGDWWRQSVILLLFMVLAPPGGGDYKMIYVVLALAAMITTENRRPMDALILVLIAMVLVPKRYFLFDSVITDSGFADSSWAIAINPLLMLMSIFLLCRDGWRERPGKNPSLQSAA